jgi:hypothetical protein
VLLIAFISTLFFMARRAGQPVAVATASRNPLVLSPAE